MKQPLLALNQVSRKFTLGGQVVTVLKQISLTICAGEMVAIMGASGSGKSTLMHLLGCLDRPTEGRYQVAEQDTARLPADALAALRCQYFGFIFQRYHLLPHLSSRHNVELAAIYAGLSRHERRQRAEMLLTQLGLAERLDYPPEKLSGGQQQRVSIARALMNGGQVILADEPTGALDSTSGGQIMDTLKALHRQGHTLVMVTHDARVAAQAERIITLHDGVIIDDKHTAGTYTAENSALASASHHAGVAPRAPSQAMGPWQNAWFHSYEALRMAWLAMSTSKLRSLLTLLGIAVGVAAVVSTAVVGNALKESMLKDFREFTTNKIRIFPGKEWGDPDVNHRRSLTVGDLQALERQPFVAAVSPVITTYRPLRVGSRNFNARISGVGETYFKIQGISVSSGVPFTADQVARQAPVAVIDYTVQQQLFAQYASSIGQILLIGKVPVQVVGVTAKEDNSDNSTDLRVWIPHTVATNKLAGRSYFDYLVLLASDRHKAQRAEQQINRLLSLRHSQKDFLIQNLDSYLQTEEKMFSKLQRFLILVAFIALLVGGIGVMNIMLVSVTERIREIGIRMAVGARQRDVQRQFLIESTLICLVGGVAGNLLSFGTGLLIQRLNPSWQISVDPLAVIGTVLGATMIGVIFGYLPARRAACLDPIDALSCE